MAGEMLMRERKDPLGDGLVIKSSPVEVMRHKNRRQAAFPKLTLAEPQAIQKSPGNRRRAVMRNKGDLESVQASEDFASILNADSRATATVSWQSR